MEADRSQSSENLMSPDQEGVVRRLPGGHGQAGGATARHKRSRSEGALARLSLRSTSSWRSASGSMLGWERSQRRSAELGSICESIGRIH